jgi:hypothetical protein
LYTYDFNAARASYNVFMRRAPATKERWVRVSRELPVAAGPTRQVKISFSRLDKLSEKQADDLVAMYAGGDALLRPIIGWEIARRLQVVKSTRLALEYLLADTEEERFETFDGLVALSWRAKGNLYLDPADRSILTGGHYLMGKGCKESLYSETRDFIIDSLLEFLLPFADCCGEAIAAGLQDKFRHIPRRVKFLLIDELRRRWSKKNSDVVLGLDFRIGTDDNGNAVYAGQNMPAPSRFKLGSYLGEASTNAQGLTATELNERLLVNREDWIAGLAKPTDFHSGVPRSQ